MPDVRTDSSLRPVKLPPKSTGTDAPEDPPKDTPEGPAKKQASGDRLLLSSEASRATRPVVETEVTDQDVTVGVQLSDKAKLTGRYVHDSPTMMQGAGLLKVDYRLDDSTTAFAGAGHMPGFFRNTIGPNERVNTPHSVLFAGFEDVRGNHTELGRGFRLDFGLQTVAVASMAYNHASRHVDASSTAGLSKATVTGEATLSRRFGNVEASIGYGNHLDLGMIGTYYTAGGKGLFPQTHFLQGEIEGKAGSVDFRASAYIPLATASNEFAADPKLRAEISAPYLPILSAVVSPRGLEQLEATKSWAIGSGWDATASASVVRPFDKPEYSAQVGLRYSFGPKSSSRPPQRATRPPEDYRAEAPRPRQTSEVPVGHPRLRDYFNRTEIQAMRGKSVEELASLLKTPEQVVAYLEEFVRYDDDRLKDAKGDYGSMTPNEVARLLKGVCRDQHPFVVSVMKEGQGVNGKTIGYAAPDTSHAIALYQDPDSGKWNVIEYGRIHYTRADSAEEAFDRIRPDALVSGEWSEKGPNGKNHQQSIRYSETARTYYRFVQPSKT